MDSVAWRGVDGVGVWREDLGEKDDVWIVIVRRRAIWRFIVGKTVFWEEGEIELGGNELV
jgi:hypothetical protein